MAKKKTTRARLVEHAATAKRGAVKATGTTKRPAASSGTAMARSTPGPKAPAAAAIPGLQMDDIQETVRSVVNYVQQNPLAAAAVAIGVGVMLTSMYWDNKGGMPGRPKAAR